MKVNWHCLERGCDRIESNKCCPQCKHLASSEVSAIATHIPSLQILKTSRPSVNINGRSVRDAIAPPSQLNEIRLCFGSCGGLPCDGKPLRRSHQTPLIALDSQSFRPPVMPGISKGVDRCVTRHLYDSSSNVLKASSNLSLASFVSFPHDAITVP